MPRDEADDEDVHTYDDKYALAEFLTNTGIAAKMNAFGRLGLDADKLQQVVEWVHQDKQSVTLRMEATDTCQFLKEHTVELPMGQHQMTREVETTSGSLFGMGTASKTETIKTKVATRVKEYHWKVGVQYRLVVFRGNDPAGTALELQSRAASTVLVTSGGQQTHKSHHKPVSPLNERTVHPPIDLNLTWFFQRISPKQLECQFAIDRDSIKALKTCKTPRRNDDVDAAVQFDKSLFEWTQKTRTFFLEAVEHRIMDQHKPVGQTPPPEVGSVCMIIGLNKEPTFNGKMVRVVENVADQKRCRVEPVDPNSGLPGSLLIKPQNLQKSDQDGTTSKGPSLREIADDDIFGPVLPLMENGSILSMGDVAEFLGEQNRSMDEAIDNLSKSYPPRQLMKLISVAEATVVLVCQHLQHLTEQCSTGVDYIEDMLKQQLVQAIGKELSSKDFDQFMRFHHQNFFGPHYTPRPFSYAIRRPNHFPAGTLCIEATTEKREPIETFVRHAVGATMRVPINAATDVELTGDCFLHGWMQHRFKTRRPTFEVVARARQFSSFLLIVGTMMGPQKFDPKHAIILQNKDEVLIPLLTNTLPSAKEFKDAIASLSPEQQDFAKAFRGMQLESSVFGVCVIQLKPQLERLLRLPDGALTKEIELTQDLMSLFVEYQIPSDLLTFDGSADCTVAEKVTAVKGYVKSVLDVIGAEKKKQLEVEAAKADMRAEMNYTGAPSPVVHSLPGGLQEEFDQYKDASLSEASGSSHLERKRMAFGTARRLAAPKMAMMVADGVPTMEMAAEPMVSSSLVPTTFSSRGSAAPAPPASPSLGSAVPAAPQRLGMKAAVAARQKQARQSKTSLTLRSERVQPSHTKAEGQPEGGDASPTGEDFTTIPKILDAKLEKYDSDNALRSTIIKAGLNWTRMRQENLLTPASSSRLGASAIEAEKKKAFDLLDAISRSGTLPIESTELHVVIAVSHCFENDVM